MMAEPTPEMIAMARRIAASTKVGAEPQDFIDGVWDNSPVVQAALAAIIETTEKAAAWLDHLSTKLITPDFLTFVGDPFGHDGQAVCADLACLIRASAHLKETPND